MRLLNFGHSLTDEQKQAGEYFRGSSLEGVIELKTQFDQARPFAEQASELIGRIPSTAMSRVAAAGQSAQLGCRDLWPAPGKVVQVL
jgi:hypothetical protein